MSFCSLCERIPFLELPQLPRVRVPFQIEFRDQVSGQTDYTLRRLGFESDISAASAAHAESFEDLFATAPSCKMCRLIADGLRNVQSKCDQISSRSGEDFRPRGQLRLCAKPRLNDGFMVLSPTSHMAKFPVGEFESYVVVAEAGFCVAADDPLAAIYNGRPVPVDPLQQSSLDLCRSWIRNCEAEHSHKLQAPKVLPGRILEVMSTPTGADIVVIREEFRELERYACLSHCWGSSQHLKTTRANISALKKRIDVADLPKTFQDAIVVTKELGLRYLWIDSLCILQDDKDDWEQQSAKMSYIFENAWITIAASCAADDGSGFLSPRPQREYISFPNSSVKAFAVPPRYLVRLENLMLMSEEPVNKRAWTLQERLLSLRTLHFGRNQISFECRSEYCTEDGYMQRNALNYMNLDEGSDQSSLQTFDPQESWNRMVQEYSNRELTFGIDKLPALGGLAHRFELANYLSTDKNRSSKYLAGLWRDNLIMNLNWWPEHENCASAPTYRAPSWSWASIDGPVLMEQSTPHSVLAEVEDSFIDVLGKNPYGTVKGGWLKIRCVTVPVHFESNSKEQGDRLGSQGFTMTVKDHRYGSGPHHLNHGTEYSDGELAAMDLHFLCLNLGDQSHGKYVRGLIVRSFDGDSRNNITTQVFRRLTGTDFRDECAGELLAMYKNGIMRSVTLV